MPKLRKQYSAEEKVRIVLASMRGELTQAQISSKYGVHATQISNWKREFKSGVADIFRNKRRKDALEKDALIEELYKEIGRQKVELDWLKKKSACFD
jgi:transposase-like protein